MAMSRKHYREVADLLAGEHAIASTPDVVTAVENITRSVADMFKRDNGHFDRQRFYDAARLGEPELAHTVANERLQAVS